MSPRCNRCNEARSWLVPLLLLQRSVAPRASQMSPEIQEIEWIVWGDSVVGVGGVKLDEGYFG